MNIAIIPARGGSKRIPKKNIKSFHGKPIIAWSIDAALRSGLFERVIVSTDDTDIAAVAIQYGAEVPFIRPADIADDYASTTDVIKHAITWFREQGVQVDTLACIYATAPFTTAADLQEAAALLKGDAAYVFSATEFSYPVFRSFRITDGNRVQMFWPENFVKRSQDLEKAYHDAGMFYFGKAQAFLDDIPLFSRHAIPYLLPHYRVQDIDTLDDWYRAENYYRVLELERC